MKPEHNVAIRGINCRKVYEDCLSCGENIVHPLCPDCIAKGYLEWIKKFPKEEKGLKIKVLHFVRAHNLFAKNSKTCIVCGKNNTSICPYCFTEYLYRISKEAGLGIAALTEFLFIFNFDFEHKGYYRELEVYGGY